MPTSCLIGSSGFVGSNLLMQTKFDDLYDSKTISGVRGKNYDTVVCAGIRSQKWVANAHPEADLRNIQLLLSHLEHVQAKRFILLSTIDVYGVTDAGHDETHDPHGEENHAYGKNRLLVEDRMRTLFESSFIIRLPALFGPSLKKNALFDLIHRHRVDHLNALSTYQWYSLTHLWHDIETCIKNDWKLVNFAPPPIALSSIIEEFFGDIYNVLPDGRVCIKGEEPSSVIPSIQRYDIRSRYPLLQERSVLKEMGEFMGHKLH